MRYRRATIVLGAGIVFAAHVHAANIRSFLEARRITPVVYMGEVEDEKIVARTARSLRAQARVLVRGVVKSPSPKTPAVARLTYDSWDARTPPYAGGPQYKLKQGVFVLAFASTFDDHFPDGYLIWGTREEVLDSARRLREALAAMTAEQLEHNEIKEADRAPQLAVYDKAIAILTSEQK